MQIPPMTWYAFTVAQQTFLSSAQKVAPLTRLSAQHRIWVLFMRNTKPVKAPIFSQAAVVVFCLIAFIIFNLILI